MSSAPSLYLCNLYLYVANPYIIAENVFYTFSREKANLINKCLGERKLCCSDALILLLARSLDFPGLFPVDISKTSDGTGKNFDNIEFM